MATLWWILALGVAFAIGFEIGGRRQQARTNRKIEAVKEQIRATQHCPVCQQDVPWIPDGGAQLRSAVGGE